LPPERLALSAAMGDAPEPSPRPPRRAPRWLPTTLAVLATVLALASVFSIWAKRQVLETDNWTDTSAALLADRQVQRALSNYLTDQLFSNVDVEAQIASALPPRLDPLAGPIAGELRGRVQQRALQALSDPRFQTAWQDATRAAHEQLGVLIRGERGRFVSGEDGVFLDLQALVAALANRVGLSDAIAGRLPPTAARLTILRPDQLSAAQDIVKLIRGLSIVLPLLALACAAAAIWLAQDRRRAVLRTIGIGLVVVGVGVLLIRSLAGDAVAEALARNAAAEPAALQAWDITTDLLRDGGIAVLVDGLIILIGVALAGPSRAATKLRSWAAPLAEPRWAYLFAAALVAALLWWGPTEGLRRPLPALVLIALLLGGVEALRRQIGREAADRGGGDQPPGAPGALAPSQP
jgi:uncharacterized protein YjeT (DUF2065 family)